MNDRVKNFFYDIDNAIYNNPTELAKEFIMFMVNNQEYEKIDYQDYNTSILSDDISLDYVTRMSLLVSNKLLLTNNSQCKTKIYTDLNHVDDGYAYRYYTKNNDLYALGSWIQKSRSLLIDGRISYVPQVKKALYDCDELGNYLYGAGSYEIINLEDVPKYVVASKKLITTTTNLDTRYIEPVLNLEMPVINEVNLENFANIVLENSEALDRFQNYLKLSFLDFSDKPNDLDKLSLDIQRQLRDIQHLYKKTINKYKINMAISSIATITATLFCIKANVNEAIKIAMGLSGAQCGLVPFLKSNLEYFTLKDNMMDNNCYFLWVLKNN